MAYKCTGSIRPVPKSCVQCTIILMNPYIWINCVVYHTFWYPLRDEPDEIYWPKRCFIERPQKRVRGNMKLQNRVQIHKHKCVNEVLSKPQKCHFAWCSRDPKLMFHCCSTSLNHPCTKWDLFSPFVEQKWVKISEMVCTSYLGHRTDELQI